MIFSGFDFCFFGWFPSVLFGVFGCWGVLVLFLWCVSLFGWLVGLFPHLINLTVFWRALESPSSFVCVRILLLVWGFFVKKYFKAEEKEFSS